MFDPALLAELPMAVAPSADNPGPYLALGLGTGFGAIGPGVGLGVIFGKTIEAIGRQPESRSQVMGVMWLGFALTEALVFYALMMSLVGFFLAKG